MASQSTAPISTARIWGADAIIRSDSQIDLNINAIIYAIALGAIISLDLSDLRLRYNDATQLATGIRSSKNLISLNLSRNDLNEEQMQSIYNIIFKSHEELTAHEQDLLPQPTSCNKNLCYLVNTGFPAYRTYWKSDPQFHFIIKLLSQLISGQQVEITYRDETHLNDFLVEGSLYEEYQTEFIQAVRSSREHINLKLPHLKDSTEQEIISFLENKPLIHLATIFENEALITELITNRVDIDTLDIEGNTPLQLAINTSKRPTFHDFLREKGANPIPLIKTLVEKDLRELSNQITTTRSSSSSSSSPISYDEWIISEIGTLTPEFHKLFQLKEESYRLSVALNQSLFFIPRSSTASTSSSSSSSSSGITNAEAHLHQSVLTYSNFTQNLEKLTIQYRTYEDKRNQLIVHLKRILLNPLELKPSANDQKVLDRLKAMLDLLQKIQECLEEMKIKDSIKSEQLIDKRDAFQKNLQSTIKTNLETCLQAISPGFLPNGEFLSLISKACSFIGSLCLQVKRETLESLVRNGLLAPLKVLVNHGIPLFEKDRDTTLMDTTLIDKAFESNNVEMIQYLLFHYLKKGGLQNFCNLDYSSFVSLSTEIQDLKEAMSSVSRQQNEVGAGRTELFDIIRNQEARIRKIEELLDIDLLKKIDFFFESKNGSYFKAFDLRFCNLMTREIDGIRASLSNWVESSEPSSVTFINFLQSAAKQVPIPGASLAAQVIGYLPKKILNNMQKSRLYEIISPFRDSGESNHFVRILSYHLMDIMKEQLILIDKYDPIQGFKVDDSKMDKLASALVSRLLLFLLTDSPSIDPKESSQYFQERDSAYQSARNMALSIIWFYPTRLKDKLKLKLTEGEYLQRLSIFNEKIIAIPSEEELRFFRNEAYRKGVQLRNALGVFLDRLSSFKLETGGFHGRKRFLTAEGFFRRAVIECEGKHYRPRSQKVKPHKYPPLILTEWDRAVINFHHRKSGTNFLVEYEIPCRRTTKSYREFYEEVNLIEAPEQLEVSEQSAASSSGPIVSSHDSSDSPIASSTEMKRQMKLIQNNMIRLRETEERLRTFEIRAIMRKINRISSYLTAPRDWVSYNVDSIHARIITLGELGCKQSEIDWLLRRLKDIINPLVVEGRLTNVYFPNLDNLYILR